MAMVVSRHFSAGLTTAFDSIEFSRRDVIIKDGDRVIHDQRGVEAPVHWSALAVRVLSQHYLRYTGQHNREDSAKQTVTRVAQTIADHGEKNGYFADNQSAYNFQIELTRLLIEQRAAFNSPVFYNIGIHPNPQCSACFINSVEDSLRGLQRLLATEIELFSHGSGTGTDFSPIREKDAIISKGGTASGVVESMRAFDASAGVIKSGGKTRRAAKMVTLKDRHPDLPDFITCKAEAQDMIHVLVDHGGYDPNFNAKATSWIPYQNANNSVRVSNDFMRAALSKDPVTWNLFGVVDKKIKSSHVASALYQSIAKAAHKCGDPGLQFDTIINDWHTCPNTSRINSSNPCSEYFFLDDSACNLASLNLKKYRTPDGQFDIAGFKHSVGIMILAQEIIVDLAGYPTESITKNSNDYRPLGLGYANLGALIMSYGLPYDSDAGRLLGASITALLGGYAYYTSAEIAKTCGGPFAGYESNRNPMLNVIRRHKGAAEQNMFSHGNQPSISSPIATEALKVWDLAYELGKEYGFRNAQVTVLPPTGTTGFFMDCDTTGIEPDYQLKKDKLMAGGGVETIINQTVPEALLALGYNDQEKTDILHYLTVNPSLEDCPLLKPQHQAVFDCANSPQGGKRFIRPEGHVLMVGAVQPFLSGGVSKTVNMPSSASIADIEHIHTLAWQVGCKSIAVYRDGSKRSQPLNNKIRISWPRKIPRHRKGDTHDVTIGGVRMYITINTFADTGKPAEVFVRIAREGSTLSGLIEMWALTFSVAIRSHEGSLESLLDKYIGMNFEPYGHTDNPEIPRCLSIPDYLARYIKLTYLPQEEVEVVPESMPLMDDAKTCPRCGGIAIRTGVCHTCTKCGTSAGCS